MPSYDSLSRWINFLNFISAFLLSWTEGRIFGPVFQPNAGLYGAIGLQPNLGLYRGSGFQPYAGLYGASGFQSNLGLYRGSGFQPNAGLYVGSSSQDKDDVLGGELLDFESAGRRDKDSIVDEHVSIGGVSSDNKWSVDRIGSSGSDRTVTFQEIFGGNGDHRNSDHAISDGFNSNGRLHTGNRLYSERRFKVTGIGKPTGNPTAGDISKSGSNNALENSTGQTRSTGSFKSKANGSTIGAANGKGAYSPTRSMASANHTRLDYYKSGYEIGETCTNYEVINGTALGRFRCPLIGFPKNASYCCGRYDKQFCCTHESNSGLVHGAPNISWFLLLMPLIHVTDVPWVHG